MNDMNFRYAHQLLGDDLGLIIDFGLENESKEEILCFNTALSGNYNRMKKYNFSYVEHGQKNTLFVNECRLNLEYKIAHKFQSNRDNCILNGLLNFYEKNPNYHVSSLYSRKNLGYFIGKQKN